ncbi:MAG: sigma-70 family RNA polymerase sigma factor [Alphaproteobacteria bacterium]|nr:sigma-70 family RNA polymerase sigma factor [Alphaproteobacteria bacterium]
MEIAWREFEQKLKSYVSRRVGGGHADDVVGDILLRLVKSRDKLEGATNPNAWVYRVAANVITDHHRKRVRENNAADTSAREAQTDGLEEQADTSETAALAKCLIPMINDLPAPYGEALIMTEIDGLSQSAAAKKLGLSVSGMKSRVQRARQKLKSVLLRCCDVAFDRRGGVLDYRQKNLQCDAEVC